MRRLAPLSGCAALLLFGCGPVDTGTGAGSAGGTGDGGAIWTQGGGTPDAGSAADAGVDAGSTGGADAGLDGGGAGADAGTVSSACSGVVPAQNPAVRVAVVPHASGEVCYNFTSDGEAHVAAEAHSDNGADPHWQTFALDGSRAGAFFAGFDLQGQATGFEGTHRESSVTSLLRWSGAGAEQRRTQLGGAGCSGASYISALPGKGTLTLGGCGSGPLTATYFDTTGSAIVSRPVADKLVAASGVVDTNGAILIAISPGSAVGSKSDVVARWFNGQLAPTTDWFALPGSGAPFVRPLIGGGAAVQSSGTWVATVASGVAGYGPGPSWLVSRPLHDYQIVRGGRAYALVPKYGAPARNQLDLVDPAGNLCGTGTFPGAEGLSVGTDGTVIGSGGEGGCSMTWWPAVLR